IVNPLPSSPNLIIEAGTVILGTGVPAMAISQEVYVVNEETVVAAGTFVLPAYIAKVCGSVNTLGHHVAIEHVKTALENSRAEHTRAVKDHINSVKQMRDDVMSLTQGLFPVSKETAWLEAEAFIQHQKVALASELKTVPDSWVCYEQRLKESEQVELAKTIIARITSDLRDEKMQEEILANAVVELE
ncbi:ATP synthase, partial [Pisolithus orientalis]|uniref:ATP synthase n=1 Tax=Pisolithus orientalis TaxID=936130 RepID=UPI0022253E34